MAPLSAHAGPQAAAYALVHSALQAGRLHHALLVTGGEAGAGFATALVHTLLCVAPGAEGDACGSCPSCRAWRGGRHPDLIELQAPERGAAAVGTVRAALARLATRPQDAPRRVVRVAADGLAAAGQNVLLKALEEPPGAATFVLEARRRAGLLPTVRSRCLSLRLSPPGRAAAAAAWQQAGLEGALAGCLSAWRAPRTPATSDPALAAAPQAWRALAGLQATPTAIGAALQVAAELGQDAALAEVALALLEAQLRDALAARFGAPAALLYGGGPLPPSWQRQAGAGLAALSRLRRPGAVYMNRTLALEGILLTLAGAPGSTAQGA